MKNTICFAMGMLCLLLLVPSLAHSQIPPGQLAKMEAAAEWVSEGMWIGFIDHLLQSNQSAYEEKIISSEDCIKLVEAVKSIAEVHEKKAAKFKDAMVRKEMVAWWKCIIAQAEAYVSYFKGDKKSLEQVEKHRKEGEKHIEALNKYLGVEEE